MNSKRRNICILRFDSESQMFRVHDTKDWTLDIIPRIGERIVFEIEGTVYAGSVLDINYSTEGNVDIFIGNEQTYIQYKSTLDTSYASTLDLRTEL